MPELEDVFEDIGRARGRLEITSVRIEELGIKEIKDAIDRATGDLVEASRKLREVV